MKITETEMRGLITGKAMPADIFVGESLAAYLVRKFTNLHTERDALAAAHSQLRESMAAIHDTIKLDGVSTSLGSLLSASKRAYEDSMPTDAYLNSVRAEGVEMFAELHDATAEKYRSESPGCYGEQLHQHASRQAVKFAAKLRAGKDGE